MYANGFFLLSVVFLPFPTSLLGEYLPTDHSSPAVILYVSTLAVQSVGWILLKSAALGNQLAKDEQSIKTLREHRNYGYYGFAIYSLCATIAFWFPLTIAVITTVVWIFWLILGVRLKQG